MSFQLLRSYLIQLLRSDHEEETCHFTNSFSDTLQRKTTHEESLIILMALVPHILPDFYDDLIRELHPEGGELPQYGGMRSELRRSFFPTGETVQYMLAGNKVAERLRIQQYFLPEHWFYREQVLSVGEVATGEPLMSGRLQMSFDMVQLLSYGEKPKPKFGTQFPAMEITTALHWDDLVLDEKALEQIHHIRLWLHHQQALYKAFGRHRHLQPGFRALFHGPSGTGKSLTATLFGKAYATDGIHTQPRSVYRIDLSQVISKYIGETEKNLEKIFLQAENKDWILLFDEADALFGKRSQTKTANDRYANQEVSYLLQRIEQYNGLVILTTNFKSNIDDAFLRRFNALIKFAKPDANDRLRLWKKMISGDYPADESLLQSLAANYELTGAQILSVIAYATLEAIGRGEKELGRERLLMAIRQEFQKSELNFESRV